MSQEIDWVTITYGAIGRDIVSKMEGKEDDEGLLENLALKAVGIIRLREETIDGQTKAIKQISDVILAKYPRLESETPNYWFDKTGKKVLPKWRHNIFKYLTLGRGKKQPTDQTPEQTSEQTSEQTPEQTPEQPKNKSTASRTRKPKQILKTMTIEQLELDSDTQSILEDALEHSGMALEDFIKQAIKVYAKTVTGKAKQTSEDLSNIPTQDLLDNPKYNTHPSRAEELTKRAIRAISYYNANIATENADRWMITQSAIASLIGSRQGTIKEIMPKYQTTIDDNNNRPEWNLNPYSNRKPGKKIEEVINLAEIILNGLA